VTELLDPADLARVVNLADFEALARERMPARAFDYVAGGAWDEVTLREAAEAWRRHRLVPRVLRDLGRIDTSGAFLGRPSNLPVAIAPMAVQGLAHPGAEAEMLAGADAAGIPYCLSTTSSMALEDVAAAAPDADRWFQLYLVGGLTYSRGLVERAEAAGYRALVVTVDLPVLGWRERDQRSGFVLPALPHIDPAGNERESRYGGIEDQWANGLTWSAIDEIRGWTSMPLVLKGILAPDDAWRAVDAGAAAVIVSTHGGRQLDRSIATADALPAVVEAVGGRAEVWVDGGITRGLDVIVAKALGASGVLIGRPFYWALAAGGRDGVARAAALLGHELELALRLLGCGSIAQVDRSVLA
jgi:isopentenyl diphosphate isomerase/L-lactate dehydrogenase-like FMN-dependent dehydrogenase